MFRNTKRYEPAMAAEEAEHYVKVAKVAVEEASVSVSEIEDTFRTIFRCDETDVECDPSFFLCEDEILWKALSRSARIISGWSPPIL